MPKNESIAKDEMVTVMENKKKTRQKDRNLPVPAMSSTEEERNFWDSVPDAFVYSEPFDGTMELPKRPPKKLVTLRMSEEQVLLLKRLALIQDKKYQTMARDWLNERIQSEVAKLRTENNEATKKTVKRRA